jgi:hypothetical protein
MRNLSKTYFEYNDKNQLSKTYDVFWDTDLHEWENISGYDTFQYDESGRITEIIYYDFLTTAGYFPDRKLVFRYDENENNHERILYSYEDTYIQTEPIFEIIDSSYLQIQDSTIISYNTDGQIIEESYYVLWGLHEWRHLCNETLSYNENDEVELVERFKRNNETGELEFDNSEKYTFNEQNQLAGIEFRTSNDMTGEIEPSFAYEFEVEDDGTFSTRYMYRYLQGVRELCTTITYEYDTSINILDLIIPETYQFTPQMWPKTIFNHKLDSYYIYYEIDFGTQNNNSSYTYYNYSIDGISSSENIPISIVNVFPNPSKDYLIFELPKNEETNLSIFNANGLLQSKHNIKETSKIDVSLFKSGIYFYIIEQQGKQQIGQFVKSD